MKIRVPIAGTIGKSVQFDPDAGARAEAAVAALAAQISAGLGGTIIHRNLQQLQVGDDHPQYTGNAFQETITGQWNFGTIPLIQGNTLAEYIEDVVGGSFFDFLQDTPSVVWTYHDTAQELEANVPLEFVQDTIGAILTDTASIDLVYNDGANTITANIIDEYVQDLVGAMLTDSTSIDFTYNDPAGTFTAAVITANPSGLIGMSAVNGSAATPLRSDGRHAIDPAIAPVWSGIHEFDAPVTLGNSSAPAAPAVGGKLYSFGGELHWIAQSGVDYTLTGASTILAANNTWTGQNTFTTSGQTVFNQTGVGRTIDINSASANGAYATWLRSGVAKADVGSALQIFGGAESADGIAMASRGAFDLVLGTGGTARFRINSTTGDTEIGAFVLTADPGGGKGAWALGKVRVGAVALDAANYVEVKIDGAVVKLLKAV